MCASQLGLWQGMSLERMKEGDDDHTPGPRDLGEIYSSISTRGNNIVTIKTYYKAHPEQSQELQKLFHEDQNMSSDHRAGLFCVLYELMTMTSEGSTKESWISLLIEMAPRLLTRHHAKHQELLQKIIGYMSKTKILSVTDQLETWRSIVTAAPPLTSASPADVNQPHPRNIDANGGAISPSPDTFSMKSSNSPQPPLTLRDFISQSCPDECGFLVNRILKKVLPALRQPPSSYPLCSIDESRLTAQSEELCRSLEFAPHRSSATIGQHSSFADTPPFGAAGSHRRMPYHLERRGNHQAPYHPHNGHYPQQPSGVLPAPTVNLHPSIPDFILEGTAHHILHSFAIPSSLEDEAKDDSLPMTKELCELTIRSLAVASICLAGKIETASRHLDVKSLAHLAEKHPVQTPFSLPQDSIQNGPTDSIITPQRSRSQSTSSLGETPEGGGKEGTTEDGMDKLIKESLSVEKRILVSLGYEFHDLCIPMKCVVNWTKNHELSLPVSSLTLDLLGSRAFLQRFLLVPWSRRIEYSDFHIALAFVLTAASQDLFDQENVAFPSDVSQHLGSILFPFPKCQREDIQIVENILTDLLGDLPKKREILDRCLILNTYGIHFCRAVVPKALVTQYCCYLESNLQPSIAVTSPPPSPQLSPQPQSQPAPMAVISIPPIPPPPHFALPFNFPPPPPQLFHAPPPPLPPSTYDDEDFQRFTIDLRSCLLRWKESNQLSSSLMSSTLEFLTDESFFDKTSAIIATSSVSQPRYSERCIALAFVLTAAAQDLFDQETVVFPTNIARHLQSFLLPFPKCQREDIPIIENILREHLGTIANMRHLYDRCSVLCPATIHLCREVVPRAVAEEYAMYLKSQSAFPKLEREISDDSEGESSSPLRRESRHKHKRKKEKESSRSSSGHKRKEKKKKKRRRSEEEREEDGEVLSPSPTSPDYVPSPSSRDRGRGSARQPVATAAFSRERSAPRNSYRRSRSPPLPSSRSRPPLSSPHSHSRIRS